MRNLSPLSTKRHFVQLNTKRLWLNILPEGKPTKIVKVPSFADDASFFLICVLHPCGVSPSDPLLTARPRLLSTVRRRREEPGCSRPDNAVLRPAGGQPGVCGHLAPARLSQRRGQPDDGGHAQHESPQPKHQQQQRSV